MRPFKTIGIGQVLWRIIYRSIAKCVETDPDILGGDQQLCISQMGGVKNAIHSMRAAVNNTDA